jgi:hypothetical protein
MSNNNSFKYNIKSLENFINKNQEINKEINQENIIDFINSIEEVLFVLFSAISSTKIYYNIKISILNEELKSCATSIIEMIIDDQNELIKKLKIWVILTNRIDIINAFFTYGNIKDMEDINLLFNIKDIIINNRPKLVDLLPKFQKDAWNLCSKYGIDYCLQLTEKAWNRFDKITKQKKITLNKDIKVQVKKMVNLEA